MKKMMKAKKTGGEILAVNEIFEKNPNTVPRCHRKLRVPARCAAAGAVQRDSPHGLGLLAGEELRDLGRRTDQHNMYKEYRDMTVNGAVSRMCGPPAQRVFGKLCENAFLRKRTFAKLHFCEIAFL